MPNSFLPSVKQGTGGFKEGAILLGDSWNMRHPLTGGGMTVVLNDIVILRKMLSSVSDLGDWSRVRKVLHRWHWSRKPLASTINILSVALYDLFGADGLFSLVMRSYYLTWATLQAKNSVSYELDASNTSNVAESQSVALCVYYPGKCYVSFLRSPALTT